jgi:hypothetical protein
MDFIGTSFIYKCIARMYQNVCELEHRERHSSGDEMVHHKEAGKLAFYERRQWWVSFVILR